MIFNIKMYDPEKSYAVIKSVGYESVLKHSHEFIEMVFVESGSAVQKINDETVKLKAGDLFVIADGSEHSIRPVCEGNDFRLINVIWCRDFIDFDYTMFTPGVPINIAHRSEIIDLIQKVFATYETRGVCSDSIFKGCVYLILGYAGQILSSVGGVKDYRNHKADYVASAVKFIVDNFNKKIALDDVAGHVGLSSGYLQKLFNKERSTSVIEYLLRYRVEQSCKLLIETEETISDICIAIGFSDIKNFHYAFKRVIGMTPNEYRRMHKMRNTEE